MSSIRTNSSLAVCALCLALSAVEGRAQTYPVKPVRLVVPFGAGGGADSAARVIAPAISERLGRQLVIDNRTGAAGTIGSGHVAAAPPDGYTLLLATGEIAITAALFEKLPYDPLKDFAPVTLLVKSPSILAVHPSLPVKSVKDLIVLARANPGKINYAAPVGTLLQLAAESFKIMAKVDLTLIPYVSSAPSVISVLSGETSVIFVPAMAVLAQTKSGKLRALAITSIQRSPALPDMPTVAESGLPGFDMVTWYGILAPAGTPDEIVTRLNGDFVKGIATRDVSSRFMNEASSLVGSTPADFGTYLKDEISKVGKVVRAAGLRVN